MRAPCPRFLNLLVILLFAVSSSTGARAVRDVAGTPTASPEPPFSVFALGGLGGSESAAQAVNDAGVIVGWARTSPDQGEARHAVRWDNGRITDLGTLGGNQSEALDINDSGVIVGYSEVPGGDAHACLWQPDGSLVDLGGLGEWLAVAVAINERGVIVGVATDTSFMMHAVIWEHGVLRDLGLAIPGAMSMAMDVNDRGTIVGLETDDIVTATEAHVDIIDHAVSWDGERQRRFLENLGAGNSTARGINNAGQIVGSFTPDAEASASAEDARIAAFRWEAGVVTTLLPSASGSSQANAINDAGVIVGSVSPEPGEIEESTQTNAFIWASGESAYLPTPPDRGSVAYAINETGIVVGWTTDRDGRASAAIWSRSPLSLPLPATPAPDVDVPAPVSSTPGAISIAASAGDMVLAGSSHGVVYALDAATGSERWRFTRSGDMRVEGITGDIVLVSSRAPLIQSLTDPDAPVGTDLLGLDLRTGALRWSLEIAEPVYGAGIADDLLLVGSSQGLTPPGAAAGDPGFGVATIDALTGTIRWQRQDVFETLLPPGETQTLFALVAGETGAFDLASIRVRDGTELWRTPTRSILPLLPAVWDGERLYGESFGNAATGHMVWAIDRSSGEMLWEWRPAAIGFSIGVVLPGDTVVLKWDQDEQHEGGLLGLDALTGHMRWQTLLPGGLLQNDPVLSEDRIVIADETTGWFEGDNATVYGINPHTGAIVWRTLTGGDWAAVQAAALPNNQVLAVVRNEELDYGRVLAIDSQTGEQRWSTELAFIDRVQAAAGDRVYVAGRLVKSPDDEDRLIPDSDLLALDASTGEIVWAIANSGAG